MNGAGVPCLGEVRADNKRLVFLGRLAPKSEAEGTSGRLNFVRPLFLEIKSARDQERKEDDEDSECRIHVGEQGPGDQRGGLVQKRKYD